MGTVFACIYEWHILIFITHTLTLFGIEIEAQVRICIAEVLSVKVVAAFPDAMQV